MRRQRRAKIVATLGPASAAPDMIAALFEAGADVFRLNFSHGTYAEHQQAVTDIRALEARYNRSIGIILDLQGPKLRVGSTKGAEIHLEKGQKFSLDLRPDPGDSTRIQFPHAEVYAVLRVGMDLLLDDGRLRLQITHITHDSITTTVLVGGALLSRKGVNVPQVALPISALTAKDRKDLAFGLELGVDWIALSFVQRPEDITEARDLIGNKAKIAAKIEKPQAIDHLEEIIALADGIMVARGDLGVEMPPEDVPCLQKRICAACRRMGKPVIVATQMLDS
ncbi:MAG: pyruvate kinase, partial [Alphaproteobacteria bacterium]